MKIICAPDSFKESLSAKAAAEAMARGVKRALPDAVGEVCPISDGGEGFTEALLSAMPGTAFPIHSDVVGPLGATVEAIWGIVDSDEGERTAVIEMAAASGLELVPKRERNPLNTTTFGTGELIRNAIELGARRILIGIGGSATNDGGCGMAQALGTTFLDVDGKRIGESMTGGKLLNLASVVAPALKFEFAYGDHATTVDLSDCELIVACDVTNPLTGPQGAAAIYGPQKGATPQQVEQLDQGLRHLARLVREQLGSDFEFTTGAGAAGGLGFGLLAFLGAKIVSGIELVLDAVRFDERVRGADLVLTGEGKLDGQSLAGKACIGVAQRAKRQGVPTVALVGNVGDGIEKAVAAGLEGYALIGDGLSLEESIRRADELLATTAERICRERLGAP